MKLPRDELETFAMLFVTRIAVRLQRPVESIQHRQQRFNNPLNSPMSIVFPLALDPFTVVLEIRLPPDQRAL